ncbi:MAG: KH domain-containing protein [Patescibacteria group bacterium]|nr:KH domain-containing protein [Patescibacteria group bacterium]
MEDLLKYILEQIASSPEKIKVERSDEEAATVFTINAKDEDKGKIIGKGGKNIKAIRDIVSIIARKENKRVFLKVE